MRKVLLPLLIVLVLMCASCSAASDTGGASVEERLAQIDAYKETISTRTEPEASGSVTSALSFRGIPFGSTMSEVKSAEMQPLTNEYSDALDFEPVTIYSYSMVPSYWFNGTGLFYSGSYSVTQSDYQPAVENLQSALTAEFGEPAETGYYDYSHTSITFASNDEAVAAIRGGEAYYLTSYTGGDGLSVDFYAESDGSGGFACYIFYSDPAFIN